VENQNGGLYIDSKRCATTIESGFVMLQIWILSGIQEVVNVSSTFRAGTFDIFTICSTAFLQKSENLCAVAAAEFEATSPPHGGMNYPTKPETMTSATT
jgi:hypothetical protein